MPREHFLAALVLLCTLGVTAAAHYPVSGLTPLSGEGFAGIEAASGPSQRRSMLQANVVPGEVNQTATDVKNAFNSATGTVQAGFNNASAGFDQLGQTSALNQASQSGNASAGDYANAFVNDTNRALGVIGSVFKNSADQSAVLKLSMVVVFAAAIMLGLPLL